MTEVFRPGTIKRFARQAMRGKWLRGILVMLLYALVINGPSFILSYLTDSKVVSYILVFYQLAISGPMIMGVTVFFLDVFRGVDEPGLGSFGRGFSFGFKAIQLYITVLAFVILWSFLFVIPGIVAAFRYSQSFFILADNPDMSPYECISRSKVLMFGIKGRYFLLQLSFIGWVILAGIPSALAVYSAVDPNSMYISIEAFQMQVIKASEAPLPTALGILSYLAGVYILAADACFYDIVSGNLKLYTEAPPRDSKGMY